LSLESLFHVFPMKLQEEFPIKSGQKRGWTFDEVIESSAQGIMLYRKDGDQLAVMTFNKFKELIKTKTWE